MNYLTYTSELSKLYEQYGYSISEQVLQNFISSNKLDVNFSINIADVRNDLSSIHKTRSALKKKNPPPVNQNSSANHDKIRTYNQYMTELERLYIQNGKCVFPDDAIRKIIYIDSLFVNRYVNGIVNNQGIDADMAREMTIVWCKSYGSNILGKEIRLI